MRRLFNKENIFALIFVIVALHPVVELDYLAVGFLGNLPRLTTLIDFVVLPILVLVVFIMFEKDKKRKIVVFSVFAIAFGIYFVIHCINANNIQYTIHLTTNFYFSIIDEIIYTITMFIPVVYVYIFYIGNISEAIIKKITVAISFVTGVPIFISNVLVFGMSTYTGYTKANFLSWFSLPFNMYANHPRKYATKFFFEEGNTIGILMVLVLPFLYYFFYKEKEKYKKIGIGLLITIQSLAMIILSTRVATYCALLVPIAMLMIYVFLLLLKKESLKKIYVLMLVAMISITAFIIPYGPAYQNQLLDAQDYDLVMSVEGQRQSARSLLQQGEKLGKWSEEWRDFYVYMFEDYWFLINVTPPIYYTEWYDYKYDPQFWVDLIFDYDLEERVNGRQIETIFTKYKWDELSLSQKLFGFGYGTFMRGGIIIERDFVQHYYSYGTIGVVLLMGVWIILLLYSGIKLLFGYKKDSWTYMNIILFMVICLGFVSSIVSGHTFDELTTSLFISLCFGALITNLNKAS